MKGGVENREGEYWSNKIKLSLPDSVDDSPLLFSCFLTCTVHTHTTGASTTHHLHTQKRSRGWVEQAAPEGGGVAEGGVVWTGH